MTKEGRYRQRCYQAVQWLRASQGKRQVWHRAQRKMLAAMTGQPGLESSIHFKRKKQAKMATKSVKLEEGRRRCVVHGAAIPTDHFAPLPNSS